MVKQKLEEILKDDNVDKTKYLDNEYNSQENIVKDSYETEDVSPKNMIDNK